MKAIILAAGEGRRLRPLTLTTPKPLIKVAGHPLIDYAIQDAKLAGCEEIVVNVHYLAEQVIRYLNSRDFGIGIKISHEKEQLLDTGGGILQALEMVDAENENVLVHNSDVVMKGFDWQNFLKNRFDNDGDATLLVQQREGKRKLLFDDTMMLESRSDEGFSFNGIHVLSPNGVKKLKKYGKGKPEAFPIMDFYLDGATIVHGYEQQSEYVWVDAGSEEGLKKANECFDK